MALTDVVEEIGMTAEAPMVETTGPEAMSREATAMVPTGTVKETTDATGRAYRKYQKPAVKDRREPEPQIGFGFAPVFSFARLWMEQ